MASVNQLHLLPKSALVRTGPTDHADWNYRSFLGVVVRIRLRLMLELLEDRHYQRLVEIGYGSGVFMPELAARTQELYGVDPHPMSREVEAALAANKVHATLTTASVESLPYEDGFFDCAVSMSVLEYIDDIDRACRELTRTLKPGGVLAVVTPGASPIWDLALELSTGESPKQYADHRQRLLPALKRHFKVKREISVPPIGGRLMRLYTGVRLIRP